MLTVSAQDLAGNITRSNFTLDVSQSQDIAIYNIFNYPNPVKRGMDTRIFYTLSKSTGVKCSMRIYSLSGKLLRSLPNAYSGIVFNGRDQMNNQLGPNIYLYQLIAEDVFQQKTAKSSIQKLLIHPPK